jgi:hypothetical protein
MGHKLIELPDEMLIGPRSFGFFEDFLDFVSGDLFTDTSGDSGAAVANVDAAGGQVTITTGATDNNEAYLLTTKELFLFAANKSLVCEARLKTPEANTDDLNVAFGFMNAVGADSILDNGGGPKASFSGVLFYKIDGGTRWNVIASVGTTRESVELTAANSLNKIAQSNSSSFQTLRIEVQPLNTTQAEARFYIDGIHVYKLIFTYTSATEMMAFVGAKAGDTNSEVVTVDYIAAYQTR